MAGMCPMETRKDSMGEKFHASRNHNHLRHTYDAPGANRTNVDWNLTLRQVPRVVRKSDGSASAPNLMAAELGESKWREPLAPEHPEGAYHGSTASVGKYQNIGNSGHMLQGLTRVSSGAAHGVDWQLNLRGGMHAAQHTDSKWKRHHARSQVSFDMLRENTSKNEDYQNSHTTPHDRRPDRSNSALPIATIRDDPISFRRWEGCEGTNVGQWRHLIEDRKRGAKVRRVLQSECTMREHKGDTNAARIRDNRSEGCIIEMLGKKRWHDSKSHEPLASRWPHGDAKLYHLHQSRPLPERDEENRAIRKKKTERTDKDIPEKPTPKSTRGVYREEAGLGI
mmetsp:Transcript_103421/g.267493  ORF Transcript_103421/g.267493 Transcript_103421/m.267493 type:complete len:338 (-) Transcript_103421:83-1096(-)